MKLLNSQTLFFFQHLKLDHGFDIWSSNVILLLNKNGDVGWYLLVFLVSLWAMNLSKEVSGLDVRRGKDRTCLGNPTSSPRAAFNL